MWSDNEASIDLLRFKSLASIVTQVVKTESLLPTTIGVYGDWGSGKSTLLKMVER
jgi:ABC-type bacteriocin/lantibiotic exporter with double-glycine peptidase domain